MNARLLLPALLTALFIAGCSGKGPDVVDPQSGSRTEASMMAIDKGGWGEILLYSEQKGIISPNAFAAANPGDTFSIPIDGIYENNDRLFLHHREEGAITVMDVITRKKLATITGFPRSLDGELTTMAFSNYSQAWVICHGSPNLFHLDSRNMVVADTIKLPGNPTNVGASLRNVFVAMTDNNGNNTVGVLRSNSGGQFSIEKTLNVPSPVIYSTPNSDSTYFMMISAGAGEILPKLHYVDMETLDIVDEVELETAPLGAYIGRQPNFAAYSREDFLYLATTDLVFQIDTRSGGYNDWLFEPYDVVGVDYYSDLFYAYKDGSRVIKRMDKEGQELPDLEVPADVRAIRFIGASKVQ